MHSIDCISTLREWQVKSALETVLIQSRIRVTRRREKKRLGYNRSLIALISRQLKRSMRAIIVIITGFGRGIGTSIVIINMHKIDCWKFLGFYHIFTIRMECKITFAIMWNAIAIHWMNSSVKFIELFKSCTVRNFRKFTKFLCHKGNVTFDDIYDVFE